MWDGPRDRLLWVDSTAGHVFQGLLVDDRLEVLRRWEFDEPIGSVLPAHDGGLVVAARRHLRLIGADGVETGRIRIVPDSVDSRLNDAACDPAGRVLVGSLRQDGRVGDEALVSVDATGRVTRLVDGVTVSNGIGFSPDGATLYYVDSIPGVVRAFDYDVAAGMCGASRVVWQGDGLPDGLNVDEDGNLWIAYFGEGEVRCLSPEGEVLAVVHVPVPNVTCAAFVGPGRDRLLVMTARRKMDTAEIERWPDSGEAFVAEVGVAGLSAGAWAGRTSRP